MRPLDQRRPRRRAPSTRHGNGPGGGPNGRPGGPGGGNAGPGPNGNFNSRPGGPGGPGGGPRIKPDLKPFVAARDQSIADQLAGNSKGQIPTNMRGPGGPGMRPNNPPPPPRPQD